MGDMKKIGSPPVIGNARAEDVKVVTSPPGLPYPSEAVSKIPFPSEKACEDAGVVLTGSTVEHGMESSPGAHHPSVSCYDGLTG
ncbi:MAG: hypothetical protein JO249_13445 [Acidobacteria bacterium]|nr:hypothetical protein [Acidobacteriota bacterium]